MTKTRAIIIFSFVLLLILPFTAQAFTVKSEDSVYVAKDEIIEGNLYALGQTITIDGQVNGDVICAGQTINVNGKIIGDIICGGQTINIDGEVGGSVRVAGNSININGIVARNVQALGASINLGTNATVGWDIFMAGAIGEIRGKVGGDVHGGLAKIIIAGEIGGDVRVKLDEKIRSEVKLEFKKSAPLVITDEAVIGGEVVYTAGEEASIASAASIAGEVIHNMPKAKDFIGWGINIWAWGIIYAIFSALVIGLVLISFWRNQIIKLTDGMLDNTAASIGWGFVIMFLTPIVVILLLITLIGIPLAFLLMLIWVIVLALSKILIGILIGRSLLDKFWSKQKDSLIRAMIIGIIVSWIIFSIPVVGWILALVAMWWGLGGIWLYYKKA